MPPTQNGAQEGHPLVATHSQLEIQVYTAPSHPVKLASLNDPYPEFEISTAPVLPLTVEYAST
jgi:hypothetical protein